MAVSPRTDLANKFENIQKHFARAQEFMLKRNGNLLLPATAGVEMKNIIVGLFLSLVLTLSADAQTPAPAPPGELAVVVTSVATSFIDTVDPVISKITYGASMQAEGAQLSLTAANFEFRVTASDNTGIAYATLEVLPSRDAEVGKFVAFVLQTDGLLPPTFWLVWNQKLAIGTYFLRLRVFDPLQRMSQQVFAVKK